MKRLACSGFLALVLAACSGPKRSDDSTPEQLAPAPAGSATDVNGDAGIVPEPPLEAEPPSDVPHGSVHQAATSRVAQRPGDAGAPVRDAGAPGRDAGAPARDAGAPAGDAGPGPGSAPSPGTPPTTPPADPSTPPTTPPANPGTPPTAPR